MGTHIVTGGAGFLGRHLVRALEAEGHSVITVDQSNDATATVDANDVDLLRIVLDSFKPDGIWLFACPASPNEYAAAPETALATIDGTRHALEWARRQAHKPRVILASSSEVYGQPLQVPTPETEPGRVESYCLRACYDEAKRASEAWAWIAAHRWGVDVRVARIHNTYGPGQRDDGRVIPTFIRQALRGQPMTIRKPGSQGRSFCYVDDLVAGLIALWKVDARDLDHEGRDVHALPVNLGDDRHVLTVGEVAVKVGILVRELYGVEQAELVLVPEPIGHDPQDRIPGLSRALSLLSWMPIVTFTDGLKATIADVIATGPEFAHLRSTTSPEGNPHA